MLWPPLVARDEALPMTEPLALGRETRTGRVMRGPGHWFDDHPSLPLLSGAVGLCDYLSVLLGQRVALGCKQCLYSPGVPGGGCLDNLGSRCHARH